MSDQAAFLAAIVANPDDDTPRLIYADWLDEHLPDTRPSPAGSPSARAEYIRVQCRLAQHPYDDPAYPELIEREQELANWLNTHAREDHSEQLPGDLEYIASFSFLPDQQYQRGFLAEAEYDDYDEEPEDNIPRITEALRTAFAQTTVRNLRLEDAYGAEVAGVVADEVASGLRGLYITTIADDDETAAARGFATSPHLKNLKYLTLDLSSSTADARIIANSNAFPSLETLILDHSSQQILEAYRNAKWFKGLREFRTWVSHRDHMKLVAEFPKMPALAYLQLRGSVEPTVKSVNQLAASRSFPQLRRLEIANSRFKETHTAALCKADWPLAHLAVQQSHIGNAGAAAIAQASFAETLQVLNLSASEISVSGVQKLAASPKLANLKHLNLSDNPIGASGLRALAKSPHLRGLRVLILRNCESRKSPIDSAAITEFLSTLQMPELRHLALDDLPVGVRGAKVIAAGGTFANLTVLSLENCQLRETGTRTILESTALPNITELQLKSNNGGPALERLANPKCFPKLARCEISNNRLPTKLLSKLRKRPGVSF